MVGHTVVELLVAATVTLLVFGAVLAAVVPASEGFATIPEYADAQQRLRALVESIRDDIWASGGAAPVGPAGRTAHAWPAILPCGWGHDPVSGVPGPCARDDTFSVVRAPGPLWMVTAAAVESGDRVVHVLRPAGCPAGAAGCAFVAGDPVMLADGLGRVEVSEVGSTGPDGEFLTLLEPLAGAYPAGSVVSSGFVRSYYARADPSTGALQLRRRDHGSDQPFLDHLAGFTVEHFGVADPPALQMGDEGRLFPSYGPAPRPAANPADGPYSSSCAFTVANGVPLTALQPLAAAPGGLARVPLSALQDGPWCPDGTAAARLDLDAYRVRSLRLTVRMQAPVRWLRGANPAWFAHPGRGRSAGRLVPDVVAVFDLAVRGGGR
jgi:hypothetical protein